MIAAVEIGKELHIVRWTGRVGLHAGVMTYCNREANAAQGVLQVPDSVFSKGRPFNSISPCKACRAATAEF